MPEISYETQRQIRDINAVVSRLDWHLSKSLKSRAAVPGEALIAHIVATIARRCNNDQRAAAFEQRAAVNPAMTTVAGWAAELTNSLTGDFILSLQRRSAMAAILARCPQVSLLGVGTTSVPVAGAAPPARIIVEGQPIPILKGAFAPATLAPFKVAAIMTFTEEMAQSSGIENAVRALLSESIASGLDAIAFAASGTGSLLAGVTPVAASTATPLETAMREDLQNLLVALSAPSPDVIFAMSPSRALFASSVLPPSFAYAVMASTAIASAQVVAVDPLGIAAALGASPRVLLSKNAAVHEDDVPGALSIVGSPNVVGAPLRSFFQADTLGLRAILDTGWVARSGAVSAIAAVAW